MTAHSYVTMGMTISVVCFLVGYWQRRNTPRHRALMGAGVLVNLATAVLLVAAVYGWGGGDFRAAGFIPTVPPWAILGHRLLAVVTTVLMLVMAYTGIRRKRDLHVRLHVFFLPLYLVVYTTGLLFFSGQK